MKNIIRCLFGIPVILSIPNLKEEPVDILLEGLAERACKYCPSLKECVSQEIYCQEFQFPYNALYYGSGIIVPQKEKFNGNNVPTDLMDQPI